MPANPPTSPSAATASRVSTPCRSRSASAWACSRSVGRPPRPVRPTTSDPRPPAGRARSGGLAVRAAPQLEPDGRFQRSARSGANVSLVTSPAQTRSHSASSISRSGRRRRPRGWHGRSWRRGSAGARGPGRDARRWVGGSGRRWRRSGRPAGSPPGPGRYSAMRPSSRPRLPRPIHATSPISPSSSSNRGA